MSSWREFNPWHEVERFDDLGEMQCIIDRIDVVGFGTVRLYLRKMHCPDMRQAVNLARWLCPTCDRIEAASGANNDTLYVRHGDEWQCRTGGRFDWWVEATL